jgi:hypothetical protein
LFWQDAQGRPVKLAKPDQLVPRERKAPLVLLEKRQQQRI